jgi:hypothetical protein
MKSLVSINIVNFLFKVLNLINQEQENQKNNPERGKQVINIGLNIDSTLTAEEKHLLQEFFNKLLKEEATIEQIKNAIEDITSNFLQKPEEEPKNKSGNPSLFTEAVSAFIIKTCLKMGVAMENAKKNPEQNHELLLDVDDDETAHSRRKSICKATLQYYFSRS